MVFMSHSILSDALSNAKARSYAKCSVTFEEMISFIDENKE